MTTRIRNLVTALVATIRRLIANPLPRRNTWTPTEIRA
jgi:hypothetical protein